MVDRSVILRNLHRCL